MFKAVTGQPNFAKLEEEVLSHWSENKTFEASMENRKDNEEFVFYDGPPFATGTPHYGHLLAGTIKDVIPRYQTMRGKYVERVFGWDCHGLPIEALAQEKLGLKGAAQIAEAGVDVFNEQCRSMVSTYVDEWERTVTRMGRWVDFKNGYKTMDKDFMESVWWVFKELWKQGRIYKSYRIMPYSWRLSTPLSNFEAGSNYKDVQDPAVTVAAKLVEFDKELADLAGDSSCHALLWTTTPWTLPANLGLCTGAEIDYVAIKETESAAVYILAQARLASYYKSEDQYTVLKSYKGSELKGWKYEPLFPYFSDQANSFQILCDDYVSTGDGTGIVHLAPAYGEDDFRICKDANIELVDPLDSSCNFNSKIPDLKGIFCKDADKLIIRNLKDAGKLVKHSTVMHSYPYCDRTDTPLIYRAIEAWYVKVDDMNDRFLANNAEVNWTPEHVGNKRFGNWLEGAKDWNISRNRYWGSCIPLWISEDGDDILCIGSIEELEELSGEKVTDLHKHFVDKIIIEKDGKKYTRTPEVLDCWFESGSMPYAQQHYPFENKERVEKNFPADFIAEGMDQTRGWFYTLMVLGTALFDKAPYQNVVVNGLILAEDGYKMSKRKKNYPDPHHVLDNYGADALRLFLMGSPVVRGENLKFSEDGVKEILRGVLIPIWNAYSFFTTYANVDNWQPQAGEAKRPDSPSNTLDRYILSSLAEMIEEIQENMDNYNIQKAANRFEKFVEDLTNWYIRRSRRRFWKSQNDTDKDEAYQTLHYVLITFCKTAAPFIPFITETIYRNLKTEEMPDSVHLCDYPALDNEIRDEYLETQMEHTMTTVGLGRYVRAQHSMKTRQPLAKAVVVVQDEKVLQMLKGTSEIIAEELNVKTLEFHTNEEELVTRIPKANFKTLGRKLGKNMKPVAGEIANFTSDQISSILNGATVSVAVPDGTTIEIGSEDLIIQRQEKEGMTVATDAGVTIALDTVITKDLKEEGLAREFVSKIQNERRERNLEVSDRIEILFNTPEELTVAITKHSEYICNETLAVKLEPSDKDEELCTEINDFDCKISIIKNK